MLSIEVNGIPLDLPEDFSATLNLKSPLFNTIGDYTFPFKLPATPKNVAALNWTHRIESNRDQFQYISADLLFSGLLIFSGSIRLKKADDKTYQGSLFVERGNFNFEIKDKELNVVDYGSMTFESENDVLDYLTSTLDRLYPLEPLACPEIYNPTYFEPPSEDAGQHWYNYMSRVDGKLRLYTTEENRTLINPSLYLQFVLRKIIDHFGYTLNDEFFYPDEVLRQLAFYTSYSINFRFWFIHDIYFNLLIPKLTISKLITHLENMFNCTFLADTKTRVIRIVSKKSILQNTDFVEFSRNVTKISVEMLKQKTGKVFTMETDAGDQLMEDLLEEQKVTLDLIRGSVEVFEDLQPLPLSELGDIVYVITEDKWYQHNVVSYTIGWREFDMTTYLQTKFIYKQNEETNKVETGLSTLASHVMTSKCGNLGSDYRDISPRLFFVQRHLPFGETYTHTWAMPWTIDKSHSLFWSGSGGLFARYWKDWIDWELFDRKKIVFEKQMNHGEIKDFDFTKKVMINGNRYLISELQVIFKRDSIATAKFKGFSCP